MVFATTNPYASEVLKTFSIAIDAEIGQAICRADAAFRVWRELSFAERAGVIQASAAILRPDSASDSPFGLGGSVFAADTKRGTAVARRISTGMVFVNHPTMVKADLPFGDVRPSGYGRELLGLGIEEFVNHKLIDVVDIDALF